MTERVFGDKATYERMLDFSRQLLGVEGSFPSDQAHAEKFLAEHPWVSVPAKLPYGLTMPMIMWSGIYGVGVRASANRKPAPVIFVDKHVNDFGYVLKNDFGLDLPPEFDVIETNAPRPQSSACLCNGRRATLGVDVMIPNRGVGVLTAGHTVNPVGAPVSSASGEPIGKVFFVESPSTPPVTANHADVAVVEIQSRGYEPRSFKVGFPPIPGDPALMLGSEAKRVETSFGTAADWIYSPELGGRWGEVYVTEGVISEEGDSGAPVVIGEDSVIGHVVGVMEDEGTIVQDLDYQLVRGGVQLR